MDSSELDLSVKTESNAIPYHHNLELEQVFDSCHSYIALVRESSGTESILSHIDFLDETLQWCSTQLTSNRDIAPSCSLLLILILQELYEVLRRFVDLESLTIKQDSASVVPPGQVLVSLEKLAEHLDVPVVDREKIEKYMFRLQGEVHHAIEAMVSLKKVVIAAEIWCNQLAALTLYCYPRYLRSVKDSTKMAFEEVKRLFETTNINE